MRIVLLLILLAFSTYLPAQNDDLDKSSNVADSSYINKNLAKVLEGIDSDSTIYSILNSNDSLLALNPKLKENYSFYSNYLRQKTKVYFLLDDIEKALGTCVISEQLQQDFAPQPSLLSAMIFKDKSQCYYLLGQMKEADLYTSKCKSIFEQLPDFQALRQYRDFLRDMGVNYINFNNFSEAKEIFLKRDEYIRSQTNIDSLELASSISDDAYLELTMGNYEYALQKLLNAKSIMELHPAEKKSFFYWDLLRNLGSGYKLIQKLDSAEFYFLQCNELSEELASITPDHRASIYLELGNLYLEKKQFKESKDYLERALTLIKDLFGEEHPLYYYILGFLGQYYFINSADTSNSAYYIFDKIQRSYLQFFPKGYLYMSIGEQEAYKADFDASSNFLFTLMVDQFNEKYAELCYDILLARKNLLLNSIRRLRTLANRDNRLMQLYRDLQNNKVLVANEMVTNGVNAQGLDSLQSNVTAIEKELAYNLMESDESNLFVQTKEVREVLQPDEISIEFFRFQYKKSNLSFDEVPTYAALILDKKRQNVLLVKLCPQAQLDSLLQQEGISDFELSSFIYGKQDVYNLIWRPLSGFLVGKKKIYVSTDGIINFINIPALPIDKNAVLGDKFDITILTSTQDIPTVKKRHPYKDVHPTAEIYFDINYYPERKSSDINLQTDNKKIDNKSSERGNHRETLVHSKQEGRFIAEQLKKAKWRTSLLFGDNANEKAIKKYEFGLGVTSPSILHFSTHGFFSPQEISKSNGLTETNDHLVRSGLIMSNPTKNQLNLNENKDDGILSALEISQLDLSETELVVLSGCETGLGDVNTSEGLYGLSRAFKIAGAANIVQSLWQIPDYQTMELMKHFYTNLIINKLKPNVALKNAQNSMRSKKYEPYFWAGFLIVE